MGSGERCGEIALPVEWMGAGLPAVLRLSTGAASSRLSTDGKPTDETDEPTDEIFFPPS